MTNLVAVLQPHTHVLRPRLEPSSEEFVLEQLGECEQKLVELVEELSSRDLDTILKEMEDQEVGTGTIDLRFKSSLRTVPCSSVTPLKWASPVTLTEHCLRRALKQVYTVSTITLL